MSFLLAVFSSSQLTEGSAPLTSCILLLHGTSSQPLTFLFTALHIVKITYVLSQPKLLCCVVQNRGVHVSTVACKLVWTGLIFACCYWQRNVHFIRSAACILSTFSLFMCRSKTHLSPLLSLSGDECFFCEMENHCLFCGFRNCAIKSFKIEVKVETKLISKCDGVIFLFSCIQIFKILL